MSECFRCGHKCGDHDEKECRGGEDIPCRCDSFEEPEEPGRHLFPGDTICATDGDIVRSGRECPTCDEPGIRARG